MKKINSKILIVIFSIFAVALLLIVSPLNKLRQVGNAAPPAYVDVKLSLVASGVTPFDANDLAGNDSNATNNIIRTFDVATYRVDINLNGVDDTNLRFVAHVSDDVVNGDDDYEIISIPSQCLTDPTVTPVSSISADRKTLTCNLGAQTEGTSAAVFINTRAKGSVNNGENLNIEITSAKSDTSNEATTGMLTLLASGTAKFDLVKQIFDSKYALGDIDGNGYNDDGTIVTYYVGLVASKGSLGFTQNPISVNDVLSYSAIPNGFNRAKLYTWGDGSVPGVPLMKTCSWNGDSYIISNQPFGMPGGSYSVNVVSPPSLQTVVADSTNSTTNSGSWNCTTVAEPNNDLTQSFNISITGADTSMSVSPVGPLFNANQSNTTSGNSILISGFVNVWIPTADYKKVTAGSNTVNVTNAVSQAFGTETNLTNNSALRTFTSGTSGPGAGCLANHFGGSLSFDAKVWGQGGTGTVVGIPGQKFNLDFTYNDDRQGPARLLGVPQKMCLKIDTTYAQFTGKSILNPNLMSVLASLDSTTPLRKNLNYAITYGLPMQEYSTNPGTSPLNLTNKLVPIIEYTTTPFATDARTQQCGSTLTWSQTMPADPTTITAIRLTDPTYPYGGIYEEANIMIGSYEVQLKNAPAGSQAGFFMSTSHDNGVTWQSSSNGSAIGTPTYALDEYQFDFCAYPTAASYINVDPAKQAGNATRVTFVQGQLSIVKSTYSMGADKTSATDDTVIDNTLSVVDSGNVVSFNLKPVMSIPVSSTNCTTVNVVDTLDAKLVYNNDYSVIGGNGGTCGTQAVTFSQAGNILTWQISNVPVTGASDALPQIVYSATVADNISYGNIVNTASVSCDTFPNCPDTRPTTASVQALNPNLSTTSVPTLANAVINAQTSWDTAHKSTRSLLLRSPVDYKINKDVITPLKEVNEELIYRINYINTSGTFTLNNLTHIDLVPHALSGLVPESSFDGSVLTKCVGLVGSTVSNCINPGASISVEYTTSASVSNDQCDVSNFPAGYTPTVGSLCYIDGLHGGSVGTGTTVWTATTYNTFPVGTTAVRITDATPFPPAGAMRSLDLVYLNQNNSEGNIYTNEFSSAVNELKLNTVSNDVTSTVIAGSIGDYVWFDENGDGVQDLSESGLSNIGVCIVGTSTVAGAYGVNVNPLYLDPGPNGIFDNGGDDRELCTTTDTTGKYLFTDLHSGTYDVSVSKTAISVYDKGTATLLATSSVLNYPAETFDADGIATPSVSTVTLTNTGTLVTSDVDQDFGYMGYKISGNVWADLDLDNAHGVLASCGSASPLTTECGLGNITVTLYNTLGVVVATVQTNLDGSYQFTNVLPGSYNVKAGTAQGLSSISDEKAVTVATADVTGIDIPKKAGSISGSVWYDANNSGSIDGTETANIVTTITLTGVDVNGNSVSMTTTSVGGVYSFTGLYASTGRYTITETEPVGYSDGIDVLGTLSGIISSGPDSFSVQLNAGSDGYSYNFGEIYDGMVSGYVYIDRNSDGAINYVGDIPISGVTVTLSNGATTTTDGGGYYEFKYLPYGTYNVTETHPSGYIDSTDYIGSLGGTVGADNLSDIVLTSTNKVSTDNDFTEKWASVSGNVFVEADGVAGYVSTTACTGYIQSADCGLGGETIQLLDASGNILATTFTQADGSYTFANVPPGNYTVKELQPADYETLSSNSISIVVATTDLTDQNFSEQGGSISGKVWADINNDGVINGTEVPGIVTTVELLDGTGAVIASTTSTAGVYTFQNLKAGTYSVREVQPASYDDGKDSVGSSGGVLVPTDTIGTIALGSGEDGVEYNFGELYTMKISGNIAVDMNGNSTYQSGTDTDLSGVIVTLSNGSTATTDVNGYYEFTNVAPGSYTIVETQPTLYANLTPNTLNVTVVATDITGQDFLEIGATLSGYVYEDGNDDGIKGAAEAGIVGVTVTLSGTDINGNAITTTSQVTIAGGMYTFTGLPAGTYTVVETQAVGYLDGKDTSGTPPGTVTNDQIAGISLVAGGAAVDHNFGELFPGGITGHVYIDPDGSNTFNAGDTGLSGVVVTLNTGATTTTDTNGFYSFTNLPAGTYTVVETQPSIYTNGNTINNGVVTGTTDSLSTVVVSSIVPNQDFTEVPNGSISGTVWYDEDKDGVLDPGETGIPGVTVVITGPSGTFTLTTDTNGNYASGMLSPGAYTVVETDKSGYASSTPNTINATVLAGTAVVNHNFGDTLSTISGTVYLDKATANSTLDGTDSGIANVKVELLNSTNTVIATVYTDANGYYQFTDIEAGTYTVRETQPTEYVSTQNGVSIPLTMVAGVDSLNNNFGEKGGSISGYLYIDSDVDHVRDSGETGFSGEIVSLITASGTITTTTDASGYYIFNDLATGTYEITKPLISGYANEMPVSGTPFIGDVSVLNDISGVLMMFPGVNAVNYNFGHIPQVDISGSVWYDVNRDGVKDASETTMLSGVTVDLKDSTGTVVATVTTDINGNYLFSQVNAGTYTVVETQPAGYGSSTPNTLTVNALTSVTGQNFGETLSTVSGYMYIDLNKDTVNNSEAGLSGQTVTLTDGTTTWTTTTDTNGYYKFSDLLAGSYTLTDANVSGYTNETGVVGTPFTGTGVVNGINTLAVTAGADGVNYNFGHIPLVDIQGSVWYDVNRDGVKDASETTMLSGVTVELKNASGTVVATVTTDTNGNYTFSQVEVGTYTVVETQPTGYGSSTPNTLTVSALTDTNVTGQNFGETLSTVSGYMYIDLNKDNVNNSEAGLSGQTVTLTDGTTTWTTTTDTNGYYKFSDLLAGSYTLTDANVSGYTNEDGVVGTPYTGIGGQDVIATLAVTAGADGVNYNFGHIPLVDIQGSVWYDVNRDGVKDASETTMLSGVTMRLLDSSGNTVQTTTTNSSGIYTFAGVEVGSYTIEQVQPTGYGSSTPNTLTVSALTDTNVTGQNFGETLSTVSGRVYADDDLNGAYTVTDRPLVTVITLSGPVNASVTANADGTYMFTDLPSGDYTITETQVVGFNDGVETVGSLGGSTVSPDSITVSMTAGVDGTGYNFGETPKEFINGTVWFDLNNDGIMDASETTMVEGVTVTLKDSSGTVVATTVTDANGMYSFGEIPVGNYEVVESQPTGYGSSTPNSMNITLVDNAIVTVNFGETMKSSIQGTVYVDNTRNGTKDTTDRVISGVTMKLTGVDGQGNAVSMEAVTDANGNYVFIVEAGVYDLSEVQPTMYSDGADNLGSLGGIATNDKVTGIEVLSAEDGQGYNFGELGGSISGVVFNDANNNKTQDTSEVIMSGVKVTVKDTAGNILGEVTTGSDGKYEVLGLAFGTYVVTEEIPANYGLTTTSPINVEITSSKMAVLGMDFGNIQRSTIKVNVYNDVNSNKVKDSGEVNFEGYVIILKDASGAEVARATSDANGNVEFKNQVVGNYSVEIVTKDGWILTTDKKVNVTLGIQGASVEFGLVKELAKTGERNLIFEILSWF